jgi:hypothetical protein
MRHLRLLLKLYFLFCLADVQAQDREEFNGPFAGWANVKERFGAKGNGKDDDTKAIQQALDYLSCPPKGFNVVGNGYMVVYLPAGTYCISSTLQLRGKIGISIIGEDPARTTIKWIGKDKDTVLWADGSAYFRISRLTWDANGKKDMEAIGIHWKNKWNISWSQSFAQLNIEISDDWFVGGFAFGISGGTTPATGTASNDSEITIRRCIFRNCAVSGIEITGFNALDYWIWDCRFLQCANGLRCTNGNYHLYHCYFSGSLISDVHNAGGYYNSIRGCYSVNGNNFSSDEGMSSNPFKRIFQDNTIIRPARTPIRNNHVGKLSLYGNHIDACRDTAARYSVFEQSWFLGMYEALSIDNVYAYEHPIVLYDPNIRIFSIGDRENRHPTWDTLAFLRTMDPTPPIVHRRVFEVSVTADADSIQVILDQAAALKGQRPVVHFREGIWAIDRTLEIPAGADMQLIGDGWLYGTSLAPKAVFLLMKKPILHVQGPSFITIENLNFGSASNKGGPAGIVFDGVDQPGSEAHLDQIYSPATDTSLVADRLDYLYIQKDNSFFNAGNYIAGGPLVRQGKGTARVCCFGGQFARVTLLDDAAFVAKDCWWEGADKMPLDLTGSGRLTIDGAMIAPYKFDSATTVRIGKFKGSISLMNMYLQGALEPQADNPDLRLLVWNIHFYYKTVPLEFLKQKTNFQGVFLGLNAQCFRPNDPLCKTMLNVPDEERQAGPLDDFLDSLTAQTRMSVPLPYKQLAPGVSNIYLSRVSFGTMAKGVVFNGAL